MDERPKILSFLISHRDLKPRENSAELGQKKHNGE